MIVTKGRYEDAEILRNQILSNVLNDDLKHREAKRELRQKPWWRMAEQVADLCGTPLNFESLVGKGRRTIWNGKDVAIEMLEDADALMHEVAHWCVAPRRLRSLPEYGLGPAATAKNYRYYDSQLARTHMANADRRPGVEDDVHEEVLVMTLQCVLMHRSDMTLVAAVRNTQIAEDLLPGGDFIGNLLYLVNIRALTYDFYPRSCR